ncbi:MAG: baseplate J/gp47 family protein [Candidatus Polarisedimenticolia bacterium]
MLRTKLPNDIVDEALRNMRDATAVSNFAASSRALVLVETLAGIAATATNDLFFSTVLSELSNLGGANLDDVAQSYGIVRYPGVPARVDASERNLRYYVLGGTFGDVNGGGDIVVPAGTTVRQADGVAATSTTYFVQSTDVVLPAGGTSAYVSASQVGDVLGLSFSPNTLVVHNFANYADAANKSLLVTNDAAVVGYAGETDDGLRYRIKMRALAANGGTLASLRRAALSVPGVSDVAVDAERSGTGTATLVVFSRNQLVSDRLVASVRRSVANVVPVGLSVFVTGASLVGLSFRARLRFAPNAGEADKTAAILAASSTLRSHVAGLSPGAVVSARSLAAAIQSGSPLIVGVGESGRLFDELLLWRDGATGRYARRLEAPYTVGYDEEMVVEPYVDLPVMLLRG